MNKNQFLYAMKRERRDFLVFGVEDYAKIANDSLKPNTSTELGVPTYVDALKL